MSALKPRSPDRYSIDEALAFASHQDPERHSKLPALRETPRSSLGSTALQVLARPKVNRSSGRTRHVPASNITISSTPRPYTGIPIVGSPPQMGRTPLDPHSPFAEHRPMTSGAITRIWPLRAGVAAIALAAVTVITVSACIIGATAAASATAARRQSGFGAAARVAV